MVRFLFTTFFGMCFVFSMMFLTIGVMFLLRVLTILWFDIDFMDKVRDWFKG